MAQAITPYWGIDVKPHTKSYEEKILSHIQRSDFKEARLKLFRKFGAVNYYSYFHLAKYEQTGNRVKISPNGPIAERRWLFEFKIPLEYYI